MSNENNAPLINRLVDELGYPRLNAVSFDQYVQSQPYSLLFFTEAIERFPESNDVAVILPELVVAFPQLSPAVICRSAEKGLQGRYNFQQWPTLVLLKQGHFLGMISRVQNWDDYLLEINRILQLQPQRNPGIGIPVVVQSSDQDRHCGH
ncbi:MAG: hypothetical protein OQK12_02250 [Motiliproteus sp.]|nr:hypothetical protein [Motiliproteus sp.]MCW9051758.1 hypothetical protein [Motiliproteus sp.]